jgi:formiminotetrahydrofolate cyclodeaminase
MLVDLNLRDFAQEVASSSPTPGGGSVAAYAGAQGFALIAMVCGLTLGREKFFSVQNEMQALQAWSGERLTRLLTLIDQDSDGFNAVITSFALPKSTETEKELRWSQIERATLTAAQVPLETAQYCLAGLQEIPRLLAGGNPNAISDMGVAALMLRTGLEGALYNVEVNAQGLKDEKNRHELFVKCTNLRTEGNGLASAISRIMEERLHVD